MGFQIQEWKSALQKHRDERVNALQVICVCDLAEVLEEALLETDAGGLMADLLLMMLTAVFSLEEEEEQEELELAKEGKDQGGKQGNIAQDKALFSTKKY